MVLAGAQMLFLGLIGEYLGRIFRESKNRPLFVINEIVRNPRHPAGHG